MHNQKLGIFILLITYLLDNYKLEENLGLG